jgi:putative ABC transport system permease protein
MAERIFAGEEPLGRRLKVGPTSSQSRWLTIVGIVGDTRHEEITGDAGIDLYVSYLQFPDANMYALVQTRVPPISLAKAAEEVIWSVDAEQSTFDIQSMEERIASRIWQQRLSGTLFVIFACLAVALAAIGIYGVMSYTVSQRTREIGIRQALGAQASAIIGMVIGESLKLVGAGIVVGLVAALAMTRLMKSLLYGVSAADPLIFSAVPLVLAAVALIAALIPALRAARVDPMIALRRE